MTSCNAMTNENFSYINLDLMINNNWIRKYLLYYLFAIIQTYFFKNGNHL